VPENNFRHTAVLAVAQGARQGDHVQTDLMVRQIIVPYRMRRPHAGQARRCGIKACSHRLRTRQTHRAMAASLTLSGSELNSQRGLPA